MAEKKCRACSGTMSVITPGDLCRACLRELSASRSEYGFHSGAEEFYRQYGTGHSCRCCGTELVFSELSTNTCSMCGTMFSLEQLGLQSDGLVATWQHAT